MSEERDPGEGSIASLQNKDDSDFVTVVSVGTEGKLSQPKNGECDADSQEGSGYVTVLKIGQPNDVSEEIIEEVLVYRLPGERLGFGLKFEGGTKAAELVKRLFIQSCAPDSPASMAHCSWGKLSEGDEVLNIDSLPVTSMTRIDCVRCLKDSNVVIKLLVRHFKDNVSEDVVDSSNSSSVRLTEDLPQVISAEKKRTPPPPPPVPPRKIPRKMLKENIAVNLNANVITENDSITPSSNNTTNNNNSSSKNNNGNNNSYASNKNENINGFRNNRFQSPRSSGKLAHLRQSPEIPRHVLRDRRLSDGSAGPPDAEVYLDLFSQESGCSLSESDDTGSSISTIIDRFGSFPTTTNSSLAGSLPSTPTSIQKQLDVSNIQNPFDKNDADVTSSDNYLFATVMPPENGSEDDVIRTLESKREITLKKLTKDGEKTNEDGASLLPPTSFQDAPLSYGNEYVGIAENNVKAFAEQNNQNFNQELPDENGNCLKQLNDNKSTNNTETQMFTKLTHMNNQNMSACEKSKESEGTAGNEESALDLPRLVHFVPKCNVTNSKGENMFKIIETVKLFLEHEIRLASRYKEAKTKADLTAPPAEIYNSELYNLNWSLSPQLTTIGEDDEEGCQESCIRKSFNVSTPIVIVENTDTERRGPENPSPPGRSEDSAVDVQKYQNTPQVESPLVPHDCVDVCETMEVPPSSSRQPPDGDEFPDYHEVPISPALLKMEESFNKPLPWQNKALWKSSSSSLFRDQQSSCSVRDKIAIFSNAFTKSAPDLTNLKKICKSTGDILSSLEKEPCGADGKAAFKENKKVKRSVSALYKNTASNKQEGVKIPLATTVRTRSSLDLTASNTCDTPVFKDKSDALSKLNLPSQRMYTRSQSLLDISSTDQIPKKDRWNALAEQRQKSLSKLKGLVIPERVVEVEPPNVVDLPEIKSKDAPSQVATSNLILPAVSVETQAVPCQRNFVVPSLTTPPWSSPNSSSIPKYSPAFKRKSLQLHNEISPRTIISSNSTKYNQLHQDKSAVHSNVSDNSEPKINANLCLADAPKSLESITSPTQSDCSFEYVTSADIKTCGREESLKNTLLDARIGLSHHKTKEDMGKSEDESDNDSAVSSSQSSYISRTSPPTSPNHLQNNFTLRACSINESDSLARLKCHSTGSQPHSQLYDNQNHRLLKPQSVEAINRKNILASAKCRSGRDLKLGSPLIQRKFEEDAEAARNSVFQISSSSPKYLTRSSTIYENVEDASNNSDVSLTQSDAVRKDTYQASLEETDTNCSGPPNGRICVDRVQPKLEKTNNYLVKDLKSRNGESVTGAKKQAALDSLEEKFPVPKSLRKDIRSTCVTDLRKSFEKFSSTVPTPNNLCTSTVNKSNSHSAINNTAQKKKALSVPATPIKQDSIQSPDKPPLMTKDAELIVLHPEIPGGSVGITIAGGSDYETKEITVHKVREDSPAHRDGRLQKGDSIYSINGKSVYGLTHRQLVALLKEPVPEVALAVCRQQNRPPPVSIKLEKPEVCIGKVENVNKKKNFVVSLEKDVSGLGLSLEGGHDSPLGDMPLLIKKVFKGGAADKTGNLRVGDELLLVNETDVSSMSRFEAWSVLKKLPEGITISLTLRR